MKITGTSASSYDLYTWCEFKYFLQQVLNFEDEAGAAALLGKMAHKVLEILSNASIVGHDPSSRIWDPNYLWEMVFTVIAEKIQI
jgi:ATP-dependent helicase/DNAse subunit B